MCKSRMVRKSRNTPSWKCTKKNCRTWRSIRKTNHFFTYNDRNGRSHSNYDLTDILKITYWYLKAPEMKLSSLQSTIGYSRQGLVDWHSLIREVCAKVLAKQPKFTGTDEKWCEVDESLFRGRRKNHKGRLLKRDRKNPRKSRPVKKRKQTIRVGI